MKKNLFFLLIIIVVLNACDNNSTTKEAKSTNTKEQAKEETSTATTQYVTAKINGANWKSTSEEILTSYDTYGDKLQIFTKDEKGKMNFLLTLAPFTKTQIGSYNSVKEGAGGYGISLLDEDKADNVENDYDNFHQGIIANCLIIKSITEVKEGKMVEGTFASPMNVSNNYEASKDKGVVVSEGKFAVFVKKY